jgi:hypothetical protein
MVLTGEIWFVCPRCGAGNPPEHEVCAACGRRLDPEPVRLRRPSRPGKRFGIASELRVWMAAIALIAICSAGFARASALGLLLSILIVPAAVWTWFVAGRSAGLRARHRELELLRHFAGGLIGTTVVAGAAALASLAGAGVAVGPTSGFAGFAVATAAAVVTGGSTAYLLIASSPNVNPDRRRRQDRL